MAKKVVSLRFEEEVVAGIDAKAASQSRSRQEWFDAVVSAALGDESPGVLRERAARITGDVRRDGLARADAFRGARLPASVHGRAKEKGR